MSDKEQTKTMQALAPESLVGNYRVLRLLEQDDSGFAYVVELVNSEDDLLAQSSRYVLRECFPAGLASREADSVVPKDEDRWKMVLADFLKEAQKLGELHHPSIVPVLRIFKTKGTAYYVSPYLGEDTADMQQSPRDVAGAQCVMLWMKNLLQALQYAHSKGICHRDIRPEHLVVTQDGALTLIGFGSALALNNTSDYAAPEQLVLNGRADELSDIYAVGATFYRLVTGEVPPSAKTESFVPLAKQSKWRKLYGRSFLELIDKALQRKPEERWPSAAACLEQLQPKERQSGCAVWSCAALSMLLLGGAVAGTVVWQRDALMEYAVAHQQPTLSQMMLAIGADADKALPQAADSGQTDIVRLLLARGANGVNALVQAVREQRVDAVRTLLAAGVDPLQPSASGYNAVDAAYEGDNEAIREIFATNRKVNARRKLQALGIAPEQYNEQFAEAVVQNNDEMVEMLEAAGVGAEGFYKAAMLCREKNHPSALVWCIRAAAQGYPQAQLHYGECLEQGRDTKKDTAAAAEWYRKAAVQGYREAQFRYAECLAKGIGVKVDLKTAAEWYRKAADQGQPEACFKIGDSLEYGRGTAKNLPEAVKWYRKAADTGHVGSQNRLARCYEKGIGTNKDHAKAFAYYRKAATAGNADGLHHLGVCYAKGIGVTQSYPAAFSWYTKAAEKGHAEAQNLLGVYYINGRGVEKNPTKAVEWYLKSAKQGYSPAQNSLGWCYENGQGVAKHDAESVMWYRRAAEAGHAVAQNNLALCYEQGRGVSKDVAKAADWYAKSAVQGYAAAQTNLGWCYERGIGVKANAAKAVEWYSKAAKQGHAVACYNLALCYEYGRGVKKNPVTAAKWYTQSAEKGYASAQRALGWCYASGFGVKRDRNKAKQWYTKAAAQGDTSAKAALKRL